MIINVSLELEAVDVFVAQWALDFLCGWFR